MTTVDDIANNAASWIENKVDELTTVNPRLLVISPRLKKGLRKIILANKGKLEGFIPFLTDDNGDFDVVSLRSELQTAFADMPKREVDVMGLPIEIGKGEVSIALPSNILLDIFFDKSKISFTWDDIEDYLRMFER